MKEKRRFFGKRYHVTLMGFIVLVICSALYAPPIMAAQRLMMGATSTASSMYTYMVAAANVIKQLPNLELTVVETGGTVDNFKRLQRGDVDFALIASDTAKDAIAGTGPFKDRANPKMRVLWYWSAYAWNIVVSQEDWLLDNDGF